MDPLIRYISFKIPPAVCEVAVYVDDIGLALIDLISQTPLVFEILKFFSTIAGPVLNIAKCAAIPLFQVDFNLVRLALEAANECLSSVPVVHGATYLGFTLGRDPLDQEFSAVITKVALRTRRIRSLGLGLPTSIALYNMVVAPTGSHLAQLRPLAKKSWRLRVRQCRFSRQGLVLPGANKLFSELSLSSCHIKSSLCKGLLLQLSSELLIRMKR